MRGPEELWRPIPNYPGYDVSTLGRVRSVDRIVMGRRRGHMVPIRRKGRPLRLKTQTPTGYIGVELSGRSLLVHRLVLQAFVGPCPTGHEVAHWDGVRSNNGLSNLRYATGTENAADRLRHGTLVKGERVGNSKLKEPDVEAIRRLRPTHTQNQLAEMFGVTRQHISHIEHGRVWL